MQFFKNIIKSVYNPQYYKEIREKPFSYSLKYYFLLLLLVSVVATVLISIQTVPAVKLFINSALTKALDYYPQELEITIKNGKVSTNVQEPYYIKIPTEWKNNAPDNLEINGQPTSQLADIDNLLVIDTKNPFSLEKLYAYRTVALLTSDSVVYISDNKIEIQPLKNISDFKINKPQLVYLAGTIKPFTKFVYPVVCLGIFVGQALLLLFKFAYLLVAALLIWLVVAIKKINLGYKKSYQLGLHLITLGVILEPIIYLLGISAFPFAFTILLLLLALLNIKNV